MAPSPLALSVANNSEGLPPLLGIEYRPPVDANTMTSFLVHVAPHAGSDDIVCGSPPSAETFCNPLADMKPIHRPLGEKNGSVAPSVPARTRGTISSSARA